MVETVTWVSELRRESENAIRLANDLEYFASERLRIRPKAGGTAPLIFNEAQRKLHEILEEQKRTTGRVRAVLLKARQAGASTYLCARSFRYVTTHRGVRAAIIAHETAASRNLHTIVKRFHDHLPEDEKLATVVDNADELTFSKIDSGFMITVANPEGSGRSSTVNFAHCSEVAFWKNLDEQIASLFQAVPEGNGTEIILESTANAFGDQFHQLWRKAEAGESEFFPIFLGWNIESGYRALPGPDWKRTAEEEELASLHGLDNAQLQWRRNKIRQLGDVRLFMREYPLTVVEAFQAAEQDSFIPSDLVMQARKCQDDLEYGPLVLGVDIARKGGDSTCIAWRRGRAITKLERHRNLDLMQVAGLVSKIIDNEKPERVHCDSTGMGISVVDRLHERGYSEVQGVNFAGKSTEAPTLDESGRQQVAYANRRAQIYGNLKQALEGRFKLPDRDDLHSELVSMGYKYNSAGALQLESKDEIKKRLGASPDLADSVALTLADGVTGRTGREKNFWREIVYTDGGYV